MPSGLILHFGFGDFMNLDLYANGKENPIGIDRTYVRLGVKTEVSDTDFSLKIKLFRSVDNFENDLPFETLTTNELTAVIDASGFREGERIYWTAELNNDNGNYKSRLNYFEFGIDFKKSEEIWIDNPEFCHMVSEFSKDFYLSTLPRKARLYIVGLGYYQSSLNGKRTDENFFKPLLTDFDYRIGLNNPDYDEDVFYNDKKSISYDTFDVTELVRLGKNTLNVLLGTGWYCNDDKLITDPCDSFGMPKLFFELHLLYENEKKEVIKSDNSVMVRNTNRYSQLFRGDSEDFTKEENRYINARICNAPKGKLIAPACEADKIIYKIPPVSIDKKEGSVEYDFGINHSGSVALKVKGERGSTLILRYYEVKTNEKLNPHTSHWIAYDVTGATPEPVEIVYQQDKYILSGAVDEIYPLFHFNCYRYLTVSCDSDFEIVDIHSLFISSDLKKDSHFECSDKTFNDYYNAFVLTQRNNMHSGVPSDCPHREKLPYTGDGDIASESAMYVFRAEEFYRKWLRDLIDSQGNNGWVPYTAPNIGGAGGFWWSNAITSLPLKLYEHTGDVQIIKSALAAALKYVDFFEAVHDGDGIVKRSFSRWYLGDWLTPEKTVIDTDFVNTMAYYTALDNTEKMCEIIRDSDNKKRLLKLKEKVKKAVNSKYFDKETLNYSGGVQGSNLLPFIYGFADEHTETLKNKIVEKYKRNPHFDTGIVLTPILFDTLAKLGESELLYRMFTSEEAPSFKTMLDGETTLVEHWYKKWPSASLLENGEIPDLGHVSHSHPMFGSIVSLLYKQVSGLDLSALCQKKVLVYPRFITTIKSASAYKETSYGKVFVKYTTDNMRFDYCIRIPYGLTATVTLDQKILSDVVLNGKNIKSTDKNGNFFFSLEGGEHRVSAIIKS